jgi:hypothetical protein
MKRMLIASLALALTSCAGVALPGTFPPPAERTTLDEKAGLAVTVAYQAANRLGLMAIRFGVAKGATAERIKQLDAQAFAAVQLARQAYLAGQASSYDAAIASANDLIAQITALSKGS